MSLNFQTLKMLHEEENVIGEEPETCDLLFPETLPLKFSVKEWCDNIDNVIKKENEVI